MKIFRNVLKKLAAIGFVSMAISGGLCAVAIVLGRKLKQIEKKADRRESK